MTNTSQPIRTGEPVLVRRNIPQGGLYTYGPGLHSHNVRRRTLRVRSSFPLRRILQVCLVTFGVAALGYYGYTLSDQFIYQKYENWAFDQQISGHTGVTFGSYVREKTPFGFLVGDRAEAVAPKPLPEARQATRPGAGSLLGRVTIDRLGLAAIVREGVDDQTLRTAVGHVPSTSLAGEPGNFAIAAHRDTLFRALKDIRPDDLISFQSAEATYTYQVAATKIVKPSDVSVLRADGGGLVSAGPNPLLTMITCYPFYYVGAAPKRFIVEARLVSEKATEKPETAVSSVAPLASKPLARAAAAKRAHKRKSRKPRAVKG